MDGGNDGGDGQEPPTLPAEHPRIYLGANRGRLAAELAAESVEATRFRGVVDFWVGGGSEWGFGVWNAALLGQLTGDPKYCRAAIRAIDAQVDAAAAAIHGGGVPAVASDSYLGVGDLIGDLALVFDWCAPEIDSDRRRAWLEYAYQAVWNVWHPDDARWGDQPKPWSGWGTRDPSNNYYYSFLRATMLLALAAYDELPGIAQLLSELNTRLEHELFPTFAADLVGGGSREGTGYGVAMRRLFELYDVWQASTNESLAVRTPHTRASMLAMIHQIVPTLDRVAPTGDHSRDSTAALFDYHRSYLQTLVSLFPHDPLAERAQALIAASSVPKMASRFMYVYDFLYPNRGVAPGALAGLATAYHAPGIGQLYARSSWDRSATWVNLIAGPYTESHAHQDQGSLMLYKEGWLVYDANVETHSGVHQGLDAHSLVRIVDGGQTVTQRVGTISRLVALHRGPGWLYAAADLTPAYQGQPAVQKVEREIVFLEPDTVVVYDRVATRAGSQQVWQLATPIEPVPAGWLATITGTHTLTVHRVIPAQTMWSVTDLRTTDPDFHAGYRLEATLPGGDERYLHVLYIGNAVSGVAPLPDGASFQLAGGHAVTVQFVHDGIGGSLSIDGAVIALGPGVDVLPE